jgi:PAS domain S-box-containing protein
VPFAVELTGGGATGDLIRAFDWGATPLGAVESWPVELRIQVQTILSSPLPMVIVWGADGILIYNDGFAEICGSSHPQALGARILEIWPDQRDFNAAVIEAGLAGRPLRFHAREAERWRDGCPERIWMDLEYMPVRDGDGRPVGSMALVFDITARVLAERRLAESDELYRFLDRLGQAVAGLHHADEVLAVTTGMIGTHLGVASCVYADMDAGGDGFTIRGDWHAPDSRSIVGHHRTGRGLGKWAVDELAAGRPLIINDAPAELPPDEAGSFGKAGIVAAVCMPLVKHGRLRALLAANDSRPHRWTDHELAVIREVAERSWAHVERVGAEANLRASEEQLRLAIDAAEIGLWDIDMVGGKQFWPTPVRRMFGVSDDVSMSLADFYAGLHPDDSAAAADAFAATIDPERRQLFDIEYRTIGRDDGIVRWVAARGRGVFQDDRCIRVIGTTIDITARKATELALRDLNETLERRVAQGLAERKLLADVVENTAAIIFVLDNQYRCMAVNRAAAAVSEASFGIRPEIGMSLLDLLEPWPEPRAQMERLWSRALAGEEFTIIEPFDGSGRPHRYYELNFNVLRDASGEQIGAYQIVHDVTERISEQRRLAEAEEQLRQTQKVEALGQLTGGVAHDFNNLLTPILGSLDLLSARSLGGPREQRLIDAALQAAERARVLVQRLLAFARRQPLRPAAVDLRELMTGMAELIASTTGPQIHVTMEVADDLPAARADYNQLEMALLNLCVNARDAMPEGGTLRISAEARRIDAEGREGLRPGDYVTVSVADTGIGMDDDTAARAIEPFFSTKGIGKGTGLGLSMVHGLTQQLGGGMTLSSRPGLGTNVELWIPMADSEGEARAGGSSGAAGAPARRGTVLLVDDEDLVRASTADMLETCGFRVVARESAEQALELLGSDAPLDLLISDHLMPGMTGTQLARRARAMRPDLPCLIVSGYADVEDIAPDLPRLAKPFRMSELSDALAGLGLPG